MGVDSGLPDFRGPAGFWNAYPPCKKLGLGFTQMASGRLFETNPRLGWGFYGHRLQLYRQTIPHAGFNILRTWSGARDAFVFTSNVDGQFQKAGFSDERIVECHGSIHFVQCLASCSDAIWPANEIAPRVDEQLLAAEPLPACARCGGLARPNVLMFDDYGWCSRRTDAQEQRYEEWLRGVDYESLVIVELGAGSAVPTVRRHGEYLARLGAKLVRINPREPQVPPGQIGLPLGASQGLAAIDAQLRSAVI